jgi:hypothetical protein
MEPKRIKCASKRVGTCYPTPKYISTSPGRAQLIVVVVVIVVVVIVVGVIVVVIFIVVVIVALHWIL